MEQAGKETISTKARATGLWKCRAEETVEKLRFPPVPTTLGNPVGIPTFPQPRRRLLMCLSQQNQERRFQTSASESSGSFFDWKMLGRIASRRARLKEGSSPARSRKPYFLLHCRGRHQIRTKPQVIHSGQKGRT